METNNYMGVLKDLKSKYPDVLWLFRTGCFYMLYGDDAIAANHILGVEISRGGDGIEITGFPHACLDVYLPKLVRAGERVAICESLSESVHQRVQEMV